MKIFTTNQIREIDFATLKNQDISEYVLVKRVANELAGRLCNSFLKHDLKTVIFAGKGNNGNDAIATATLLKGRGIDCDLFIAEEENSGERLPGTRERLLSDYIICTNSKPQFIREIGDIPSISADSIIIDGIFGTGISGTPKGIFRELIDAINLSPANVISIDIPSGMAGDAPAVIDHDCIVKANHTLTLEFPKLPFFLKESYPYTGEWEIVNIGLDSEMSDKLASGYYMIDKETVRSILRKRGRHSHKGDYGHGLLIAGSRGMAGAAVLSAKSAMRAGAGLLTTIVPQELYSIMQISVPEAMCEATEGSSDNMEIPAEKYSAAAIGPGLGRSLLSVKKLEYLLTSYKRPVVFDADAINIIASDMNLMKRVPDCSIFTPHPGEFRRLAGEWSDSYEAISKQKAFSSEYNVIVVLKGAYTSISTPDGEVWFNSTGNPGMATAGSGDVLTGVILALLTQGYSPKESALAGVFIHGLAGDIALTSVGEESLIASDIISNLGSAFKLIKEN